MYKLILIVSIAFLSGCGQADRLDAAFTGHSATCIGGVEYLQFTSGASVAYTPDGKIKTCK